MFRTKHPAQVMVLGVVASDGRKMDPFFFKPNEKIGTEAYYKALRWTILPWLRPTTLTTIMCGHRMVLLPILLPKSRSSARTTLLPTGTRPSDPPPPLTSTLQCVERHGGQGGEDLPSQCGQAQGLHHRELAHDVHKLHLEDLLNVSASCGGSDQGWRGTY